MLDIKFSIRFPGSHSRKNEVHISNPGDPTYFVESLHNTLIDMYIADPEMCETILYYKAANAYRNRDLETSMSAPPDRRKGHTIRAGGRWKPGDQFVPKIWPGRPYHCSPVAVGPPITIVKTWTFVRDADGNFFIDGKNALWILPTIAANDGLSMFDFLAWFKRPFNGQIICFDPRIDYRPQELAETTNVLDDSGAVDPYLVDGMSISAAQAIFNAGRWIEESGSITPEILRELAERTKAVEAQLDASDSINWKGVTVSIAGRIIDTTSIQYPSKFGGLKTSNKVEDQPRSVKKKKDK